MTLAETPGASPPSSSMPPLPAWVWVAALLGLAWNVFGVVQFLGAANGTVESFMKGGMTREQAELYFSLPFWMNASFAVGVFGGLAGSALTGARRKLAVPVLWVSLAAYAVLYVGDITLGVFAAFGMSQVVVLTAVLVIAAALLWLANHLRQRALLK